MDIISYRGPGTAGGVSSSLNTAWRSASDKHCLWWHIKDTSVAALSLDKPEPVSKNYISPAEIDKHYRYCNEFLWPVLHDLPQHARYCESARAAYKNVNARFAQCVTSTLVSSEMSFVQDYQLALMPLMMREQKQRTVLFWHVPWPRNVYTRHVEPLRELAAGMLGAERLGFHTEEYGRNFMRFVQEHMPGAIINNKAMSVVTHTSEKVAPEELADSAGPYITRPLSGYGWQTKQTKIVVAPLSIDFGYWAAAAAHSKNPKGFAQYLQSFASGNYILSVDRADYTKGIVERLKAIERFYVRYPDRKCRIRFVQVCGRTRAGLKEYDQYWAECRQLAETINRRWSEGNWSPILWVDTPLDSEELAFLYRNASGLLVTAVRDGLNLTAKEYIAAQSGRPGVLLLSHGAGVFHEIGDYAIRVEPGRPDLMAEIIAKAVQMPTTEKAERMRKMLQRLQQQDIHSWWSQFSKLERLPERIPASNHLEPASLFSIA